MIAFALLLVIVAIVLGIGGVAVNGLLYLLIIGIVACGYGGPLGTGPGNGTA